MGEYRRLTRSDRYQIEKWLAGGKRVLWVADKLGFHRCSIYREIERGTILQGVPGGKKKGEYSAREAHRRFLSTFHDSRQTPFYRGHKIKGWVEDQIRIKLAEGWSPEQISNRLFIEKELKISFEAIYKYILSMKRRGDELHKCLRHYRRGRRRFKKRSRYWELQERRRRSIDDRPAQANQREIPGHWERDLMLGKRGSGAILALVDRKSHLTFLKKLENTTCKQTSDRTVQALKESGLPCLSITNDNGHEFGEFWKLEKRIKAKIYFAHPLCPWERGTVENTIGLLRQFVPKKTDLTTCNETNLKRIEYLINSRPRKGLGFRTPLEFITGKIHRLIKKKRTQPLPPEYYERYYLSPDEYKEREDYRRKLVALNG